MGGAREEEVDGAVEEEEVKGAVEEEVAWEGEEIFWAGEEDGAFLVRSCKGGD